MRLPGLGRTTKKSQTLPTKSDELGKSAVSPDQTASGPIVQSSDDGDSQYATLPGSEHRLHSTSASLVNEFGRSGYALNGGGHADTAPSSAPATTPKRSFFRRGKSYSISLAAAVSNADKTPPQPVTRPSNDFSHPLRQQTLPVDLVESTSKRNRQAKASDTSTESRKSILGFAKRSSSFFAYSSAQASTSAVTLPSNSDTGHGDVTPLPSGNDTERPLHNTTASFQLRSFRNASQRPDPRALNPISITALAEQERATYDAEKSGITASPVSTRPHSPASWYQDGVSSQIMTAPPSAQRPSHSRQGSSPGSISVAKFREAKAARSTTSLHSLGSHSGAPPTGSGSLNLDLPPVIPYSGMTRSAASDTGSVYHDAIQEVIKRASTSFPSGIADDGLPRLPSRQTTTAMPYARSEGFVVESRRGIAAPVTAPSSPRTANLSPPPFSSSRSDIGHGASTYDEYSSSRSRRLSNTSATSAGFRTTRLAVHPDVALPLPPIPQDPNAHKTTSTAPASTPAFMGHSRRGSVQSTTSVSSVFGNWLSAQTANLGLAAAVEDVHRTLTDKISQVAPTIGNPLNLKSAMVGTLHQPLQDSVLVVAGSPDISSIADPLKQSTASNEQEILASSHGSNNTDTGFTGKDLSPAEIDELLGGKTLPPPPSIIDDELSGLIASNNLAAQSYNDKANALPASPSHTPSQGNSSLSSFRNAAAALSSEVIKFAKAPALSTTGGERHTENSSKTLASAMASRPSISKPKGLFGGESDSDSDSDVDSHDTNNSDASQERAARDQKSRTFPPPRPVTAEERQKVYASANASTSNTPQISNTNLSTTPVASVSASFKAVTMPTATRAPLTLSALNALNKDEDDEEDMPLTAIVAKRGAQSEMGMIPRSSGAQHHRKPMFGSTIGVPTPPMPTASRRHPAASSLGLPAVHPPRSSSRLGPALPSSSASSVSMQSRSLSGLTQGSAKPPLIHKSHSNSSVPSLGSLIAAELRYSKLSVPLPQDVASVSTQRIPSASSASSGSSVLRTPSELSAVTPAGSGFKAQHSSRRSEIGISMHAAEMSSHNHGLKHSKTRSVPFVQLSEDDNPMMGHKQLPKGRDASRQDSTLNYGLSGNMPPTFLAGGLPAVHHLGCPPGVDPLLYASLPNDQKLALQQRSQQLVTMMQSYAVQAPHRPPPFAGNGHMSTMGPMPMFGNAYAFYGHQSHWADQPNFYPYSQMGFQS